MNVGETIERFRVVEVIGGGGMGTVVKAWDPKLERHVAIKVLEQTRPPEELATRRTIDLRGPQPTSDSLAEARVMAQLAHPNVVPIFELGVHDDKPYLVMELVEGADLRSQLATASRATLLGLFAQAGRGLAAAHARGIVHRDFKPENVLVGKDGRARVADFGIAGLIAPTTGMTRVGAAATAGTPAYMAPELFRGESPTARSDIYAFCVALFEALAGERPPDDAQLLEAKLAKFPSTIRTVIARGLSADPAKRPADLDEVVRALEPRKRGAWIAAAGIGIASAITAVVVARASADGGDCGVDDMLRGRWSDTERAAVREGLPPAVSDRVIARFDDYAKQLVEQREQACAARDRDDTTAERHAARIGCLDRRAFELGAVAKLLASAKPDQVDGAIDRAYALGDLAPCIVAKRGAVDPAKAASIEALQKRLVDAMQIQGDSAVAVFEALATDAAIDPELELQARLQLGQLLRRTDNKRAVVEIERAHQLATKLDDANWIVRSLSRLASVQSFHTQDYAAADAVIKIADAQLARPDVSPHAKTRALFDLAMAYRQRERWPDALERLQAAYAAAKADGSKPLLGRIERNLGAMYYAVSRDREALPHHERALEIHRELYGDGHPEVAYHMMLLAKVKRSMNDVEEARQLVDEALAMLDGKVQPDDGRLLETINSAAITYMDLQRNEEAAKLVERIIELGPSSKQPLQEHRAKALEITINSYSRLGKYDQARTVADLALAEVAKNNPPDSVRIGLAQKSIAIIAIKQKRYDEAIRALDIAEPILQKKYSPTDLQLVDIQDLRGTIALARKQWAAAEQYGRTAVRLGTEGSVAAPMLVDGYLITGRALIGSDRHADAVEPLEKALAIVEANKHAPKGQLDTVREELARAKAGPKRGRDR